MKRGAPAGEGGGAGISLQRRGNDGVAVPTDGGSMRWFLMGDGDEVWMFVLLEVPWTFS
jgi:hypothetical protein